MGIGSIISGIGGVRASALLVLCMILASVSCSRGRAIERLEAKAAADKALVQTWERVNGMNVAALESLQRANSQWRWRSAMNAQAALVATETLKTETAAAQAGLALAHEKRRIIYRDKPNAHAWSTDAVPADVYAGMRDE